MASPQSRSKVRTLAGEHWWPLVCALLLDWLFGEPPNTLHPVAWLGRLAAVLERRAPRGRPWLELGYGAGIAGLSVLAAVVLPIVLGRGLRRCRCLALLAMVALLKTTFAWHALIRAGADVRRKLEADRIAEARAALRALVSRETAGLDASLVAAAAIESLAENTSDSLVAPLLYYRLFGLPGACVYRAVNTLDAIIGYHGRYEYLGKVPARLDDALNWVPARLTALLIVAAAALAGADPYGAAAALRRDHSRTASPNAGYPMSAIAGALGVRLEKVGHYRLNTAARPPTAADIHTAERVVSLAMGLAAAISLIAARAKCQ
jgi:adenosylcobinamide-phosphate synthase